MIKHMLSIRGLLAILLLAMSTLSASSAMAQDDCQAEFFEHADFTGHGFAFKKAGKHYYQTEFTARSSGLLGFWGAADYMGDFFQESGEFFETLGNDTTWDTVDWNDTISSVRFAGADCAGAFVSLSEHRSNRNYGRRLRLNVTREVHEWSNLADHGFNDIISDIRVYFDPGYSWADRGSDAKDVGVGADGSVYMIGASGYANGRIYRWTGSGWAERYNLANVSRIDVDPNGFAWVTTPDGSIYRGIATGSTWAHVPNMSAKDIGAGADGTVMVAAMDGRIWTYNHDGTWRENYNLRGVKRIDVAPDGLAWVVTDNGVIYRQTTTGSGWQQVYNALARDISVDSQGRPWIATTSDRIYYMEGGSWMDTNLTLRRAPNGISVHDQSWVAAGVSASNARDPIWEGTEVDIIPPVITLNGPDEVVLQYLQEPYVEQDAVAYDGTVPCGVSIDNGTLGDPANPNPGYHTIIYTAADMAGNFSTIGRTVIVVRPVLHTFQSYGNSLRDLSADMSGFVHVDSRGYVQKGLFPLTEVNGMIGAARIAAAPGDMAWVVKEDGSVHTLHPDLTWTQAHNGFVTVDIAVGPGGTMKLVDTAGIVHSFNVGGVLWQEDVTGFFVRRIAVGAGGNAWVANHEGIILYQTNGLVPGGGGFQHLDVNGPRARDLALAPDGSLWIIAFDGLSIHQFKHDGTGWQPEYYLGGVEAASITVDGNGNPWFVGTAGGVLYSW